VATWCHLQCFVGAPLVIPDGRAGRAWEAALRSLEQRRPRASLLVLELMPVDGPAFASLQQVAGPRLRSYERYCRAVLRRESLVGDAAPLRGRRRRELERRARQVERATGAAYETEDVASEPGALDAFLRLEAAGWTGRLGTALDSQPGTATYAREAAAALHRDGRLVLLSTRVGARLAAGLFAIRRAGTLFMYKIAYDEELAPFSPGTQLVHDLAQWFAADESLTEIDSCADPANEFINRLFPDRKTFATVLVPLDRVGACVATVTPPLVQFFRRLRRRG
jgi:CelD/BcsL family acetyltransferase involved in cellulose biosynthesis